MSSNKTRVDADVNAVQAQYAEVQQQLKEALNIRDQTARETKIAVLKATLQSIRDEAPKEQRDLAEAVCGINDIASKLDVSYDNLQKPNAEEVGLVEAATDRVAKANADLDKLIAKTFVWDKATKIADAKSEITKAELGIKDAKLEAGRKMRKRLMEADFESSTQQLNLMVDRAISSIEARRKDVLVQIDIIGKKKVEAIDTRIKAAAKMDALDKELVKLEGSLETENEKLGLLENGSEKHSEQLKMVSELKRQHAEMLSNRNAVLAVHQSAEVFSIGFEAHEETLISLAADQRVWALKLKSDKQQREASIKSLLEIMKSVSDMEIAKGLNDVVSELDMKTFEKAAKAGVAVRKNTVEMMKKQPALVNRVTAAVSGQKEALDKINAETNEIIERMKKQYSDFPSFDDGGEPAPATPNKPTKSEKDEVDELLS